MSYLISVLHLQEIRDDITKKRSVPDDVPVVKVVKAEKSAVRLGNKLDKMITEIEKVVDSIDEETQKEQKEDVDSFYGREPNYCRCYSQPTIDKVAIPKKIDKIEGRRFIDIEDVLVILRKLDKVPDDIKWKNILSTLDEDHDGKIEIDHLMKVC